MWYVLNKNAVVKRIVVMINNNPANKKKLKININPITLIIYD
jgi:hypothetical protein